MKKMKKIYSLLLIALTSFSFAQTNVGITGNVGGVYINEIHYDNASVDVGEFIEVAGPAGIDLSTYTITLYNGSNNTSYNTLALSGVIDNEGSGVGAVSFSYPVDGIQNGAPDAIALSKTGDTNIQYISYEGVMTAPATNGPAVGLNSVDIIASEIATAIGSSLEYNEATSSWVNITDDTPGIFAQGPVLSNLENTISGLSVFPNPVKTGIFYITTDANAERTVTIFDLVGKQILNATTSESAINVANLNSGVYMLQITEEGKTATKKLVIR
jgi:Secretion system C-terminal sorting domain